MLSDENARLLLRVAGQLPEAAVIPTARLALLSGLQDVDEWERPLSDDLDALAASLVEAVDGQTIRLHPLVREFAETLTPADECVEQTLTGHLDNVNDVAMIDKQLIISASDDRTVKLWNLTTGKVLTSVALDGEIECIKSVRNGSQILIIAGDAAGSLYCLELVEGKE